MFLHFTAAGVFCGMLGGSFDQTFFFHFLYFTVLHFTEKLGLTKELICERAICCYLGRVVKFSLLFFSQWLTECLCGSHYHSEQPFLFPRARVYCL